MLTVGGGSGHLRSKAAAACLWTPEDAGMGHPVASCTMQSKLVGVSVR
jgi:hypothetical protein